MASPASSPQRRNSFRSSTKENLGQLLRLGSSDAGAAVDLAAFEQDALVWVSDAEQVWISGKVAESSSSSVSVTIGSPPDARTIVVTPTGGVKILRRNIQLLDDGAVRFDDLTEVPELHEAAVLQALDVRFAHGRIYTLSGPVLLAVNPFRALPGLFSPETLCSFVGSEKLEPHVYSVANNAYQGIRERSTSQTVLVSGESGAGKTETTKFVMQFLALAGAEAVASNSDSKKPLSRVEKQVLGSNPLLEAFGNAKTLRNDNSSRFGKYIELQFGNASEFTAPRLIGARVHTYLLEQVRVTDQQAGERNFHIFYQVLAGANAGLKGDTDIDNLHLDSLVGYTAASFKYLRRSSQVKLAHADDWEDFGATTSAMRTVGFNASEISDVFRMLAAVLHLGNVEFMAPAGNSEASEVVSVGSADGQNPLDAVANLLGLPPEKLQRALCARSMHDPHSGRYISMANNTQQAEEGREALGRHLYHVLFRHIVERTNQSIGFKEEAVFCGVLDIFGFEFFEVNSFEQLCINFTNELLQQYFNSFIFENETALYQAEGITWNPLNFPDNACIVDLLKKAPGGVLPMLDEECFVIGGSSASWQTKLVKAYSGHARFRTILHMQGTFVIEHFAGPVNYTAEGFLEKNRDRLSGDLLRTMKSSLWPFLSARFAHVVEPEENQRRRSSTEKRARVTVSLEFRQQLDDLMSQIRSTVPHFVRCIKPNSLNQPFVDVTAANPKPLFNRPSVAEQLSYQGVLEAIRVARAGYPVRFSHREFFADFRCLAAVASRRKLEADENEAGAANVAIVQELLELPELQALVPVDPRAIDPIRWAVGKTRVFLKQKTYGALKAAQNICRGEAATRLQAKHRACLALQAVKKRRSSLIFIQALQRGRAGREAVRSMRRERAATLMVAAFRTLLVREEMRQQRMVADAVQRWARMRPCRKRFLYARACAVKLQAWWRGLKRRWRWRELPQRTLHIQRVWRGAVGRRAAKEETAARHRFRWAVRRLVRIRRKNVAHRAWRKKVLDMYHGFPAPVEKKPMNRLLEDYVMLEQEYKKRKATVQALRKEKHNLLEEVKRVKSCMFPSLGF